MDMYIFNRKLSGVINIIKFRLKRITIGRHFRALGNVGLDIKGRLTIGNDFRCNSGIMNNPMGVNINSFLRVGKGAEMTIGNNVGISSTVLWCDNKITIGDNVRIGARTIITDSDAHSLDPVLRQNYEIDAKNAKTAPVIIGKSVFIGTSCIICKGVSIGENSVIGAGSVVTKDVPANVIAAGNPCKVIRNL